MRYARPLLAAGDNESGRGMYEEVDEFLAHYGIKGMHWGVVHEPDSSTGLLTKADRKEIRVQARQDKREGRAQKFVTKANSYQERIDAINATEYTNRFTQHYAQKDLKDLTKLRDRALSDAEAKRQGKLSSGQKKVIVGAAVVAALIASKVMYDKMQSGEARVLMDKGRALVQGKSVPNFKTRSILANKDLSADMIHKLVVEDINPGYGLPGTKVNCRRATFAYEMRRRGYDVMATKTTNGSGQNVVGLTNAITPGSKMRTTRAGVFKAIVSEVVKKQENPDLATPITDLSKQLGKTHIPPHKLNAEGILSMLANEPNGSRGELGVNWLMGGGHSMAYEIVHGKPVVFDTQSGKKLDTVEALGKHGLNQLKNAGYTRLDNVDLNEQYLRRWVKGVK